MPKPRTIFDYSLNIVEASKSVLIELITILSSYKDALILIGGWVPYFLLEKYKRREIEFKHIGSIDIDVVIDPAVIDEDRYATIVQLLLNRRYKRSERILYQFEREITSQIDKKRYAVGIDFLTPKPVKGKGRTHRHREIQKELMARTLEDCEIAIRSNIKYNLRGMLPDNGETEVEFKMADVVSSLALKGIAIGQRYVEKDAYDIYSICKYYKDGPMSVAKELKSKREDIILQKSLDIIGEKFRSPDAEGPCWIRNFMGATEQVEIERIKEDAFMNVTEVIKQYRKEG